MGAPADNPFIEQSEYRPEIYAVGIRNALGLFVYPETGQIWETENGPMGGDEINVIESGRNYGWLVVSYGADYSGNRFPTWKGNIFIGALGGRWAINHRIAITDFITTHDATGPNQRTEGGRDWSDPSYQAYPF